MPGANFAAPGEEEEKEQLGYAGNRPVSTRTDYSTPGADEKLAALLSYLVGWVTGLIFYYVGKSKYVRFHALQSIVAFGAITVLQLVIWLVRVVLTVFLQPLPSPFPLLNLCGLVGTLIWVGTLVLWAFLMAKAYQGESYRFPVAGEIAARGVG